MSDGKNGLPDDECGKAASNAPVPTRRSFLGAVGAAVGAGTLLAGEGVAAEYDHELVVRSTATPAETGSLGVTYEFTTTGEVVHVVEESTDSAEEANDRIVDNGDGTWTVTGKTGNGFGDTFRFDGRVTEFVGDGAFELELDGEPVAVDELTSMGVVSCSVASLTTDFTEYAVEIAATSAPEPVFDDPDVEDHLLAESGDTVTEIGDGRYLIEGRTGTASGEPPAYGDTFRWVPAADADQWGIVDFSYSNASESDLTVVVDGQTVAPSELSATSEVEFSLSSLTTDFTEYAVEVAAESARAVRDDPDVEDRLLADDDDTVTEIEAGRYRIEGRTGTASGEPPAYGDTFRWTTAEADWGIVDFSYAGASESDLTVTVDGQTVSPAEIADGEARVAAESIDPVIGGGEGYENTVSESEADVVVATRAELVDALSSASAGDVVYVDGTATIDAGKGDFRVPDGVTLASDRGIDGAAGGAIEFTTRLWPQMTVGSDARVTGLRVAGLDFEYEALTRPRNIGILTKGSGVEIDNCEVAGFRGAAVSVSGDDHVHHCSIHDNQMDGLGYGVRCTGGTPTVEYCRLDRNRHSVMSSGSGGYTFRYNVVGDTPWGIPIDIHAPGSGDYEVHHNTVRAATWPADHASRDYGGDELMPAMQIRGEPDSCAVHDNWFYNPEAPTRPADGYGSEALVKADPEEWVATTWDGNHYGTDEPDTSTGHPR